MPAAMVGSAASANQTASSTTGFSAATLPHLLIVVLAIAGVMTMGGGLLLFGSGFSAAPQSLVGPSPVTTFTVTQAGVRWGNESWFGDFLRCASTSEPVGSLSASSPPGLLAGPSQLTAVRSSGKGWSRPLLPDHAELAAAEEAQRDAARAKRGGWPIRRALTSQFNQRTHLAAAPDPCLAAAPVNCGPSHAAAQRFG